MSKGYFNVSVKKRKFKSTNMKSLSNMGVHLLRLHKKEYLLADQTRKLENELLIGDPTKTLATALKHFLKAHEITPRNRDTVQAYELVFSIPSKYLKDEKTVEEFKKATLEFVNSHPDFAGNCIALVYHGDETQPHLQGIFVPKVGTTLNFKKILGGPDGYKKLGALHDAYAKVMEPLGFERGDGTHTKGLGHMQYVKAIAEVAKPPVRPAKLVKVPTPTLFNKNDVIKALETNVSELKRENMKLQKAVSKIEIVKSEIIVSRKSLKSYKEKYRKNSEELYAMQEDKIQKLREIPCEEVLESLGYDLKIEGTTTRLKTEDMNLVVSSNNKFTENKSGAQGYGAVDLLIKVFSYSFKEARDFLSLNFGFERTAKVISTNVEQTERIISVGLKSSSRQIPKPKPENNSNVCDYLIKKRGIDKNLVYDLIRKDVLFADQKNNCVFLNDNKTFAFIRGTYEGKRFVGVAGEIDYLRYEFPENNNKTENLYLFESVIDALSYRTKFPHKDGTYIVLNGSALMNQISQIADNFDNVHCCFDNDEQGIKFCDKIKSTCVSKIVVDLPNLKDWNEELIHGNTTTNNVIESRNRADAKDTARKAETTVSVTAERDRKAGIEIR